MKLLNPVIVNELRLSLTDNSVNDSALLGCVFYQTKTENIYLTNYDLREGSDLSKKHIWMVIKTKPDLNYSFVSTELLFLMNEETFYEFLSQEFIKKIKK